MGFPISMERDEIEEIIYSAEYGSRYYIGRTSPVGKIDSIIKATPTNQDYIYDFIRIFHSEEPNMNDPRVLATFSERHTNVGIALYGKRDAHLFGAQFYKPAIEGGYPLIMTREYITGLVESLLAGEGMSNPMIDKAISAISKLADDYGFVEIQADDESALSEAIRVIVTSQDVEHRSIVHNREGYPDILTYGKKSLSLQNHTMGVKMIADTRLLLEWAQAL